MSVNQGLKDNQREQYTRTLEKKLGKYQQEKLKNWQNISQGIILNILTDLDTLFTKEIDDYNQQRNDIREILNQGNFDVQKQTRSSTYKIDSSREASFEKADAHATRKMIFGAAGGTLGGLTTGLGGLLMADIATGVAVNLAPWIWGAGGLLSLTPIGWALLGASAVAGGGFAWRARRKEAQKFQENMLEQVKEAFKKLLEPDQVSALKEQVGQLFDPYEKIAKLIGDDVQSLEDSLNNLLESKRRTEVNTETEKERLQTFINDISAQLKIIEEEYNKISLG